MSRYGFEERLLTVKTDFKNGEHFTVTIYKLRDHFAVHNPRSLTDDNLIKKFKRTFLLKDGRNLTRRRPRRSTENIVVVSVNVAKQPIRHFSQELIFHCNIFQRILTKYLHLHA